MPRPPFHQADRIGRGQGEVRGFEQRQLEHSRYVSFCLLGDMLEQYIAPGDILVARSDCNDILGHMLLAVAPPIALWRNSVKAQDLVDIWSNADNVCRDSNASVSQLWRISCIKESVTTSLGSRKHNCEFEVDIFLVVEPKTCRMVVVGEMLKSTSALMPLAHQAYDLWQSPLELRRSLRLDLMAQVFDDIRFCQQPNDQDVSQTLASQQRSMRSSVYVIVIFWQRYLRKLAETVNSNGVADCSEQPIDLILRWMPARADCVVLGELLDSMKRTGWICMTCIPRLFTPMFSTGEPALLEIRQPSQVAPIASGLEPPGSHRTESPHAKVYLLLDPY